MLKYTQSCLFLYEIGAKLRAAGYLHEEIHMSTNKKKKSLTWSMMGMLMLGWLLPLMAIGLCTLYFYSSMLSRQIEKTITSSTDKAVEICDLKLEQILTASKNASYDTTIRDSYYAYKETGNEQKLYADVTYYLNRQYKYDSSMLCTMVFLTDNPENIYYTYNTYQNNNQGNEGYNRVTYFEKYVKEQVLELGEELDTDVRLLFHKGHLYMIRNLVDVSFQTYAMIVIELHMDELFSSLDSVWGAQNYQVYLEDKPILTADFPQEPAFSRENITRSIYITDRNANYSCRTMDFSDQKMVYAVQIDQRSVLNEMNMLQYVILIVGIFLIPLMMMIFYFFSRNVSRPMRELVKAAEKISEGHYGHQITAHASSREFDYLEKNFNTMSMELKYQFETIYEEELALRDANIKALQSQINPHFLNNTLEIINWEARMSGSENVSGMIEALGTMLSATMNRKQKRFVTLSEEFSYVDAYLYIISKRFGDRFQVYRDIDESLLQMEVPILIIQPIVENAVQYGVEEHREGMVAIRVYADWDKMIIEVENDGVLSDDDRERIDFLLNGEEQDENEHHVSLGIRNVNRRIKIIYGDDCGLTIESDEENHTISRIVVKMLHEGSVTNE